MKPTVTQGKRVLIRDFFIFQLKLVLDGLKDIALLQISLFAVIFDLVFGRRGRPKLFYGVLRLSERFDLWLNLYAPAEGAERTDDGLFGASEAGDGTLVGRLEEVIRDRASDLGRARTEPA